MPSEMGKRFLSLRFFFNSRKKKSVPFKNSLFRVHLQTTTTQQKTRVPLKKSCYVPPARCPFSPTFFGKGAPTKIDGRKKGHPCSSLSTGGPRQSTPGNWRVARGNSGHTWARSFPILYMGSTILIAGFGYASGHPSWWSGLGDGFGFECNK